MRGAEQDLVVRSTRVDGHVVEKAAAIHQGDRRSILRRRLQHHGPLLWVNKPLRKKQQIL